MILGDDILLWEEESRWRRDLLLWVGGALLNRSRVQQGPNPQAKLVLFRKLKRCIRTSQKRKCRYSYIERLPCIGGIQMFPAVSSSLVVSKPLRYFRSASSSACIAQGKAALNIPEALI